MKQTGIIFSGEMVRAVLDGRKTVTRRVVRFPSTGAFVLMEMNDGSFWPYVSMDGESLDDGNGNETPMRCPYGGPGDGLWVRETLLVGDTEIFKYAADGETLAPTTHDERLWVWKQKTRSTIPSIRMPRWASRITLEIVSVRPERLQEITWRDALREGIEPKYCCDGFECACQGLPVDDPVVDFQDLWDSINPRYPWESNPVVWRIEFRRLS